MDNEQDPSSQQDNYCICKWRVYQLFNPNEQKLDLMKRSFTINSNGVLVKFTIDKFEQGEIIMRKFAQISEKYDKTVYDMARMKGLGIISDIIDFRYVNKMGNI